MNSDNERINMTVSAVDGELTIRHGEAHPPIKLRPTHITGQIGAPAEYVAKRKDDITPSTVHVLVDEQNASIKLTVGEDTELASTVTGRMMSNPDFTSFRINGGEWESPKDLGEFLRKNRVHFADRERMVALVDSLLTFRARVEKEVEKEVEKADDKRGNKRDFLEQKVSSDVPKTFTLSMPLHKGSPPSKFEVELFFDVRDAGCKLSLQSIEAEELRRAEVEEAIKEQLPAFGPYVTIFV